MSSTTSNNTTDILDTNQYLATIFQPWKVTNVRIPDLDMTTSRSKSSTLTNNFTTLKDQFLLMSVPANNQGQLRLYARTTQPGPSVDATMFNGYLYVTTLPMDEQLSDSYVYGRLISSGLRVSSATRPTGTVDINGTMNAIHYQDLPSLKTLTFSSIPSYKRNNVDVKSQVSVADGLVSLHQPFGEQQFNVFDTSAVEHAETILDITRTFAAGNVAHPWPAGAVPANGNVNVAYFAAGGGVIPEGIRGRMRITINCTVTGSVVPVPAQAWELQVTAWTPSLSSTDWNSVTTIVPGGFSSFILGTTGVTMVMDFFSPAELRGLQFSLQNRNAIALDPAVTLASMTGTFTIESFSYYDKGYNGPGALIGVSGMNPPTANYPGQVMSIAGVYNYEVVPNSFLARQVGTEYGTDPENPLLMKAAEFHITSSEMPFLYTGREYDTSMAIGKIENKLTNQKVLEAAGFGDFLKQILNVTKPILSAVPVLGPVVDALTSTGVYRPVSSAGVYAPQSSSGSYRYPTNPPRRLNAAYVGEYLDLISALPDPVMLEKEKFEVDNQANFIQLNGDGKYIKDANSAGSIQQGTLNGLIAQVNYGFVCNRFMLVDEKNNRGYTGYVYASSQPLVGEYTLMQVTISDTETVSLRIASNVTLSKDALWALGTSAYHAGKPSDFITVVSPINGDLQGPSLGLAALLSMCRRNSYAALTGFVDIDGNVVAVSKIEEKLNALHSNEVGKSVPLITPYDETLEDTWLNLLREKKQVVDTFASSIGEFGVNGVYPRLIFVNNISAIFLAAINLNFMASGSRYTTGAPIPEIRIEGQEVFNQKGVASTLYVPVKMLETYDWGYGKGVPEQLMTAANNMGDEFAYMREFDKTRADSQAALVAKKLMTKDYSGLANVLKATQQFNEAILMARNQQPMTIKGVTYTLEQAEQYMQEHPTNPAFVAVNNPDTWLTVRKNGSALNILKSALNSGGKGTVVLTQFANPGRRTGLTPAPKPTVPTTTAAVNATVPFSTAPSSSSSSTSSVVKPGMASFLGGDLPPPSDLFPDAPPAPTSFYLPPDVVAQMEKAPAPAPTPAPAPAPAPAMDAGISAVLQALAAMQAQQAQMAQEQAAQAAKVEALAKKGGGPSGVRRPAKS